MPRRRAGVVLAGVVLAGGLLAGCGPVVPGTPRVASVSSSDLALIRRYVDAFNATGEIGVRAQTAFLRATQEPGTPPPGPECLGQVTLRTRLVDRTVRPDPGFVVPRPGAPPVRPAGAVYVAATGVTTSLDGVAVREQISSRHLVIREGQVYGYAPCPD